MFSNHSEAQDVLSFFRNSFQAYKKKPIVLYGLGINTKILIRNLEDYHIAGVMDAKHEGEAFEGLPVLSEEETKQVTDIIVIIARAAVVPLIYDRICHLEECGISIYNIRGVNLGKEKTYYEFPECITKEKLEQSILEHDIICFDIFDTLIGRKVVRPEDIFEIVERRLARRGLHISYQSLRKKASDIAYQKNISPTLMDIYAEMKSLGNITQDVLTEVMEEELHTELDFISPRESVVSLLAYARKKGKLIYLISDMYLKTQQMTLLLEKCGIRDYDRLLISCEYENTKWPDGKLFEVVKKENPAHVSILHIGDNDGADIQCALKQGLDAIKVPSNYELMLYSPFQTLLSFNRGLGDSIAIGIFACKYLSDPFQDHTILSLKKESDVGFISYGALSVGYLVWILKKCRSVGIDFVAFIARDGWILNELWMVMKQAFPFEHLPDGKYILGSRRALAVAAIRDKKDLENALQKTPDSMDYCKMLSSRFGIDGTNVNKNEDKRDCVLNREGEILRNAGRERDLYNRYIDRNIGTRRKIAVIDAISSGTIGKYFYEITQREGVLLSIVLSRVPNYSVYDEIESYAYMGEDSKYAPTKAVHKYVGELEGVLTAYEPMFICFDKSGKEQYAQSEPNEKGQKLLKKIHAGIFEYAREIFAISPDLEVLEFTPELCDAFFSLYYQLKCCFVENIKEDLKASDDF